MLGARALILACTGASRGDRLEHPVRVIKRQSGLSRRRALLPIFTIALHAAVFLRASSRVEYRRIYEEISMAESFTPFRLCFRSLFEPGRGYAFPCDCNGFVVLDDLSEKAR